MECVKDKKAVVFFATIPQFLTDKNCQKDIVTNACFSAPSYVVDNKIRQKDIDLAVNPLLKKQRYFVWQLLCHALKSTFGDDFNPQTLTKDQNGKWHCPLCQISLAHSQNLVVVALSNISDALGVDVERLRPTTQKLADKILSDAQKQAYLQALPKAQDLMVLTEWCKREATFKAVGISVLAKTPAYDGINLSYTARELTLAKERYLVVVAHQPDYDVEFCDCLNLFNK